MLGKHKSLQNPIAGMIKILQFARRNGLAGPILLYQKHFIKCKGREENPWAWQIHFILSYAFPLLRSPPGCYLKQTLKSACAVPRSSLWNALLSKIYDHLFAKKYLVNQSFMQFLDLLYLFTYRSLSVYLTKALKKFQ